MTFHVRFKCQNETHYILVRKHEDLSCEKADASLQTEDDSRKLTCWLQDHIPVHFEKTTFCCLHHLLCVCCSLKTPQSIFLYHLFLAENIFKTVQESHELLLKSFLTWKTCRVAAAPWQWCIGKVRDRWPPQVCKRLILLWKNSPYELQGVFFCCRHVCVQKEEPLSGRVLCRDMAAKNCRPDLRDASRNSMFF